MIYRNKKNVAFILVGLICFSTIFFFYERVYIIKGFSYACVICSFIILGSLLIGVKLVEKFYKHNKGLLIIRTFVLISITFLLCFTVCEIKRTLHDEERFYSVPVDGITDKYEIILYEYNSFRSNAGCLCVKINNLIYKRIPNTEYSIESGHSLTESDNLILDYDSKTKILVMRYRWKDNSEYDEKATMIELDV